MRTLTARRSATSASSHSPANTGTCELPGCVREPVILHWLGEAFDPHLRGSMRDEIARILRSVDVTVVLVTHDREEAFSLADRIALMRNGAIVQEGSAEEVYLSPASRWAAEFVGAGNFVVGELSGRHSPDDVVVFKSNGIAAWDVAIGAAAVERARERGAGREL